MSAFLEMGGYAAYVWPSYLISAAALGALFVFSWRRMKRSERLAALAREESGR